MRTWFNNNKIKTGKILALKYPRNKAVTRDKPKKTMDNMPLMIKKCGRYLDSNFGCWAINRLLYC